MPFTNTTNSETRFLIVRFAVVGTETILGRSPIHVTHPFWVPFGVTLPKPSAIWDHAFRRAVGKCLRRWKIDGAVSGAWSERGSISHAAFWTPSVAEVIDELRGHFEEVVRRVTVVEGVCCTFPPLHRIAVGRTQNRNPQKTTRSTNREESMHSQMNSREKFSQVEAPVVQFKPSYY